MANPNFIPNFSTNELYRDLDLSRCLTDDLDTIDSNISSLQIDVDGKADANHTHTDYAEANHTHDGYAALSHTHSGYAVENHTHTAADVGAAEVGHTHSSYASSTHDHDSDYAALSHTHSDYASSTHDHDSDYAALSHTHTDYASSAHDHDSDYAALSHTHSGYASSSHTHSGYASSSHNHDSNYAALDHTHSGYASSSHTHSNYLPTSGGTVSGNLNVTGIVRVNSKQMLYDSGTMTTLATNNQPTMIAGSQVYSKTAITVSSDERLKRDITTLDKSALTEFIKKLNVVSYNYNDDAEGAQAMQEADSEIAKYFVVEDENGMLGVQTANLVYALIAAVQQLFENK